MLHTVVLVLHLGAAVGIIGLVLLQHGKGADAGAAFGSGASSTVFGARGAASFLTRSTAVLATMFFLTSMLLAYLSGSEKTAVKSVTELVAPETTTAPAAPMAPSDVPVAPAGAASTAPADVPATPAADVPAAPAAPAPAQ